jgi:hypothetical protein
MSVPLQGLRTCFFTNPKILWYYPAGEATIARVLAVRRVCAALNHHIPHIPHYDYLLRHKSR